MEHLYKAEYQGQATQAAMSLKPICNRSIKELMPFFWNQEANVGR